MAQVVCIIIALSAISVDLINSGSVASWLPLFRRRQTLSHAQSQWRQTLSQSQSEDVRLLRVVENAESQMLNSIIKFPDYYKHEHSGASNDSHRDTLLVKAFVGEGVNLTCSPEFPIGYVAAGFVEHLTWKHNGQPVGKDLATDHSGFTQVHNSDWSILKIFPVTHQSAGHFECFQRCLRNPANLCVQRRYTLLAVPQAVHHVFLEPIQLLPISNTTELSFSCTLQIECLYGSDPYFIWKYRGMFLAAPEDHFIHRIGPLQTKDQLGVSWLVAQYNHSASNQQTSRNCFEIMTLTVLQPDYQRGDIECWARTDPTREQWFMQKKHVR